MIFKNKSHKVKLVILNTAKNLFRCFVKFTLENSEGLNITKSLYE